MQLWVSISILQAQKAAFLANTLQKNAPKSRPWACLQELLRRYRAEAQVAELAHVTLALTKAMKPLRKLKFETPLPGIVP